MRRRHRVLFPVIALFAAALCGGEATAKNVASKKVRKKAVSAPKANTRAVSELMGPFKWGMSPAAVMSTLGKQIDAKYEARIEETRDIYTQDKLRKDAVEEKERVKKTFTKFSGKKTGWDVSLVDKEFTQKNDESMLVYWETDEKEGKDQRRFFFFADDQLWKMFVAFNAEKFEGKKFQDFKGIMEARYGAGKTELVDGIAVVMWRSSAHFLRALDLTTFYGNFCMAISDNSVESWIPGRRKERNPSLDAPNSIIETITEGDKNSGDLRTTNENVIDNITSGKTTKKP